jgi:hypothetical protein
LETISLSLPTRNHDPAPSTRGRTDRGSIGLIGKSLSGNGAGIITRFSPGIVGATGT